jgi:LPS-assembly protein
MDGQMQDKLKASGDVVVIRDNQTLEADWLDYYQQQNRVKAGNHFRLTRDKDVVTGTTLDYWMDEHTGSAQQPSFQMGSPDTNNKPGGASAAWRNPALPSVAMAVKPSSPGRTSTA